jgi:hypothetical protein
MTITDIAKAFSRHRFEEAFPHLAPDARWVLVGEATLDGRDAIIAACRSTTTELAATTTEFPRFLLIAGAEAVAVDAVGRYVDAAGQMSVVSSCDL